MKQNKKIISLILAVVFILIMGIGMYLANHVYGYKYGDPKMFYLFIWIEVILAIFGIISAATIFKFKNIGFEKTKFLNLLWMTPHMVVVGLFLVQFIPAFVKYYNLVNSSLVIISLITCLLVGFGEEIFFRGFILHSFKENKVVAVFVSSLFFGMLHLVNYFGGQSLEATIGQFINTFLVGIAYAITIINVKNLVLLMIFHGIWDFILFIKPIYTPKFLDLDLVIGLGVIAMYGTSIVLIILMLIKLIFSKMNKNKN